MKLTTLLFLFLSLLSMGVQADGKLAFINVKIVLEKSPQAIAANAQLKEQFGERELNFRKLVQEIQQMEKTYQTDGVIMSAEQKKKAEDNIIQKQRRVKFEQQSLKEDLQRKQRELSQVVQSSLREVIQAYGTENGYDFIFTDSNVAFASDAVNITDDILKEMQK
jgi:outer membrane protein